VAGGAALTYFFVNPADRIPPPAVPATLPAPSAEPTEPAAAPSAEASAAAPLPAPAVPGRLAVDFEHPLRSGLLRIWLDEELIVEQRLAGQASKKALLFTVRKGSYKDVLEVPPGRHSLRVKVAWEDNERTERIAGTFRPGATRRLQVRLGRLRKNLTLEWE
jgi:hypothetical protein